MLLGLCLKGGRDMAEIDFLDKVWTEFLTLWPVEKVRSMTLEQYHTVNDSSCFQRCLESGATTLGSIWGGNAFKFGIYQRANRDENKQSGRGYTYGDVYASCGLWWSGRSPFCIRTGMIR